MRSLKVLAALCVAGACNAALACDTPVSVCARDPGRGLGLVKAGQPAAVLVEAGADAALQHVGRSFVADLSRVAGRPAAQLASLGDARGDVVLIAELGRSPALADLVARGKLQLADLQGRWEAYRQVVVEQPWPGVPRALVIAGADRRGAVFGTYDVSARMGVSPWAWWADVPVAPQANVYLAAGARRDQPEVKYRGFFINDEAPALSTWANAKFGGANAAFYGHVFELLLRLRGNYLWPAMWQPRAFGADDPKNMALADEMGVVMGTSHHEPMMRAHDEWARAKGGVWDYAKNAPQLREFWRGGVQRMMGRPGGGAFDSLVTIGMRGDGDEPMSEGTAISLLEGIVKDQRQILADVTRQPAAQTPQMWALYKEVQDYYDKGMQVPDDVLLLFCDDNWGQVRRLPTQDLKRAGGYGMYYHFDYVGGPRNYKWLNTNQIEKTWQQMNLTHERGADALWIVNVGDIKPMEFPLQFFLDMAWSPKRMTPQALAAYPRDWAAQTFGAAHAAEIGELVTRYSQYAARRKPELIDATSFALGEASATALDGGDFGRRVAEWDALEARVDQARRALRPDQLDAYFQLVEHPVRALANLYRLYYAVAWNRKLAAAGDARANVFASQAEAAFARDQALADQYHAVAGGKWAGMMLQTHIGYTTWQQPDKNLMPAVKRVAGALAEADAAIVQRQLVRGGPAPQPGVTVIEAPHFSRAIAAQGLTWTAIPNLGQHAGAITALPQGRAPTTLADGVRVEYDVDLGAGDALVKLHMAPTLDTRNAGGIRLAVALDDQPAQVLRLHLEPTPGPEDSRAQKDWAQAVKDNDFVLSARFAVPAAGRHVLRLWRLDDNAVVQRLVIEQQAPAGAAHTGVYRNLLRELRPDVTEAAIDAKLAGYWRSLFEGSADRRVVYPAAPTTNGPAAYVLDVGNADVRSEGMSYGMMIAVQMGRQAEFNALWNWAATHMRYASGPREGYFRWQCKPTGCGDFGKDAVPASDGEEYFATALLMAASRWGNGQGLYDYNAQAQALLRTMLHKEAMNGGVKAGVRAMFSPEHGQVVFVPIGNAADFSDPSYHLPAFYEIWARRADAPQDRQRWAEIARISRAYFSRAAHPATSLTPDYAEFDGRPHKHEGHEDFRYDAFRTAVNWSVDQAWWGANPAAAGLSRKLLGFFAAQGPGGRPYPHLYTLDGKPLNDEPSKGLIASNAVAALLVEPALAQRFVDDLWALEPPSGPWRYYDGLLQFMGLLHVTGRFKAW